MDLLERVVTVGVYIVVDGRVVFVCGPTPAGDRLAILRAGGHREPGESPWECAVREAMEETGLQIEPVEPPATWLWHREAAQTELAPVDWPVEYGQRPVLVLPRGSDSTAPANLTFLARAEGNPRPDHEVRGLLLLRPDEVVRLAREPMTLAAFREAGGQAVVRQPLPETLPFHLGLQVTLLAHLLENNMLKIGCDPSCSS